MQENNFISQDQFKVFVNSKINLTKREIEIVNEANSYTEEVRRSVELEQFYSVLPAFRDAYDNISYNYKNIKNAIVSDPYISSEQPLLTVKEIKAFLNKNGLI